jgi:hypothetical protein
VKAVFPKADEKWCDYVLWNHTGYPGFIREPVVRNCYQQIRRFKRLLDRGLQPYEIEAAYEAPLRDQPKNLPWGPLKKIPMTEDHLLHFLIELKR